MLDMAFVRSPLAHASIKSITKPDVESLRSDEGVYIAADLIGVTGIVANSALPGFRTSEQPILAASKVRHVGEPIVACLAQTRAAAEDLAEAVQVDLDEIAAVVEMTTALDAEVPLLHDHWTQNAFLETRTEIDFESAITGAAAIVKRSYRTARQCMALIEGRGCVAEWDRHLEQSTIHSATQMPHIVRSGLAECLGLDHAQVRIIAPDVGGGRDQQATDLALSWCGAHRRVLRNGAGHGCACQ